MARTRDPIGRLDQRITLQRNTPVNKDGFGAPQEEWADVATVWAAVDALSGRELLFASQMQAQTTHKIKMRYRADLTLTADMRAKLGARLLNFAEAPRRLLDEEGEWWEVLAVEKTP